jgi:hypothetical protein
LGNRKVQQLKCAEGDEGNITIEIIAEILKNFKIISWYYQEFKL